MAHNDAIWQETAALLPPVFDAFCDFEALPRHCAAWPLAEGHSGGGTQTCLLDVQHSLKTAAAHGRWHWPEQPIIFISDPHADAEGFLRSLAAAGVIRRSGQEPRHFCLTGFGQRARIVVGGDCLDKGPSNLDMLDALDALFDSGADVHLLAGNHDLRFMLAVQALTGARSPLTEHLFVRMGRKTVPLLREVWDRFRTPGQTDNLPDEAACRARIFPGPAWETEFPPLAAAHLSAAAITKELARLRNKQHQFDKEVAEAGMTMRMVYAAALMCRSLFLAPDGPYAWFYQRMNMIQQSGSLLFVHAGLDDAMCALLAEGGADAVNTRFRAEARQDPFAFYFGPVANLVRTKYRETDKHLSETGVKRLHAQGIKMVVQGHVNNHHGQRLLAKRGLLHLEGDVTLDRASRRSEGLAGIGVGATLIYPTGDIVGLSSDFPAAKHFHPERPVLDGAAA
ncbi:Calcineurin-like phosphoesterase [Roseovarius tolerans]|uniref:Calcineurin-like phosphoesterase n=1 Tax=Roseovarius tolerans TaxID=74031 RepID=A0A1H8AD26_9RHOB|nr:metallophosphoesterase [Roseovarius tolerans]SEM68752.1 Calcineurin-like phosphoesterase [Roseovarius tolerans]